MATEAALLGTPSLFVNTITAGNWVHLRDNYELLYFYTNGREAMDKARELLAMSNLKEVWTQRRSKLLSEKINLTPWIVNMGKHLLSEKI
jgi:predicted glycosyltransferase